MSDQITIRFDCDQMFVKLAEWQRDRRLVDAMLDVVRAHAEENRGTLHVDAGSGAEGREAVSEIALARLLASPATATDVGADRRLSNCIAFNLPHVQGSVRSLRLARVRRRLDRLAAAKLRALFENGTGLHVHASGHFHYPPGSHMGWHTNLGASSACWRMYVSYVAEPGRSFFRYRDPDSETIVTSYDEGCDFRLFQIRPDRPFWHAVHAETDRVSVGYAVTLPLSLPDRIMRRYRRMRRALRVRFDSAASLSPR